MSEDPEPESEPPAEEPSKKKRVKVQDIEDLRQQDQQLDESVRALDGRLSQLEKQPKKVVDRDAVRLWWGRALVSFGGAAGIAGVVKLFLSETWDGDPYRALSSLAIFGLALGLIHIGQRLFISETTHADIERERAKAKASPEASPPVELVKTITEAVTTAFRTAVDYVKRDGKGPPDGS